MKKFEVYEDTELKPIDLEIRRLSKINYGIEILKLLNVTKLHNGKYEIKFVNQDENQKNSVKLLIIKNGEEIKILGKTYNIDPEFDIQQIIDGKLVRYNNIYDKQLKIKIKIYLKRTSAIAIVEKISLIVPKGFNDECSRCNRPSTMLASDNRRYCSVECFLKKCVVCGERPGIRYWKDNYYCKECFSDLAEQIDLSELKVF